MPLLPDTAPGEKFLLRVWNTLVRDGIGSLLSPWQIRREGRARTEVRAHEMLVIAQAERDVADIRTGRKSMDKDGKVVSVASQEKAVEATYELLKKAEQETILRQLKQQINLTRIAALAEDEALAVSDDEVSAEQPDPDWLNKWRNHAQDVSSAQMQQLWARLLSGELKHPKSYSLHTVEALSRMSADDARNIAKLSPQVVDGHVPTQETTLPLMMILSMQELGILTTRLMRNYKFTPSKKEVLVSHDKALIIHSVNLEVEFNVNAYKLTRLGQETLSLGKFSADVKFLERYAKTFLARGLRVSLADVLHETDDHISVTNERELHES
jgi:hypothetical protein